MSVLTLECLRPVPVLSQIWSDGCEVVTLLGFGFTLSLILAEDFEAKINVDKSLMTVRGDRPLFHFAIKITGENGKQSH